MLAPGGILCSGNIVLDFVVRPVGEIEWGVTQWVESIEQHLGGNAANTSCAIAMLGVPARILAALGPDPFSAACLDRLTACGVDTRFLEHVSEPAATSVALVRESGARTFLHRPGASRVAFAATGFPAFTSPLTDGITHYHLANLFALPQLRGRGPAILAMARGAGLTTSLDTAHDAFGEWMRLLEPCLPLLDILFVNEDEAHHLTGSADPDSNACFFLHRGVRLFVMKLGAAGCAVFPREGQPFRSPGFAARVVDTTGAGDCFAGAFLASLARGLPLDQAARMANAVGALTVEHAGGTSGLRPWDEVRAHYNL